MLHTDFNERNNFSILYFVSTLRERERALLNQCSSLCLVVVVIIITASKYHGRKKWPINNLVF